MKTKLTTSDDCGRGVVVVMLEKGRDDGIDERKNKERVFIVSDNACVL